MWPTALQDATSASLGGSFQALALERGGSGGRLPPRTPAAQPLGRQESPCAVSRCPIGANPRVLPPTKGAGEPELRELDSHGPFRSISRRRASPSNPMSVSSFRAAEIVVASKSWRGIGGSR
jgi:hypothetical protein